MDNDKASPPPARRRKVEQQPPTTSSTSAGFFSSIGAPSLFATFSRLTGSSSSSHSFSNETTQQTEKDPVPNSGTPSATDLMSIKTVGGLVDLDGNALASTPCSNRSVFLNLPSINDSSLSLIDELRPPAHAQSHQTVPQNVEIEIHKDNKKTELQKHQEGKEKEVDKVEHYNCTDEDEEDEGDDDEKEEENKNESQSQSQKKEKQKELGEKEEEKDTEKGNEKNEKRKTSEETQVRIHVPEQALSPPTLPRSRKRSSPPPTPPSNSLKIVHSVAPSHNLNEKAPPSSPSVSPKRSVRPIIKHQHQTSPLCASPLPPPPMRPLPPPAYHQKTYYPSNTHYPGNYHSPRRARNRPYSRQRGRAHHNSNLLNNQDATGNTASAPSSSPAFSTVTINPSNATSAVVPARPTTSPRGRPSYRFSGTNPSRFHYFNNNSNSRNPNTRPQQPHQQSKLVREKEALVSVRQSWRESLKAFHFLKLTPTERFSTMPSIDRRLRLSLHRAATCMTACSQSYGLGHDRRVVMWIDGERKNGITMSMAEFKNKLSDVINEIYGLDLPGGSFEPILCKDVIIPDDPDLRAQSNSNGVTEKEDGGQQHMHVDESKLPVVIDLMSNMRMEGNSLAPSTITGSNTDSIPDIPTEHFNSGDNSNQSNNTYNQLSAAPSSNSVLFRHIPIPDEKQNIKKENNLEDGNGNGGHSGLTSALCSPRRLDQENRGYAMLERMGWRDGQGLGSDAGGIQDPVLPSNARRPRRGLGR